MEEEAEHVRKSFANTKMVIIHMNDISKHLHVSIDGAPVYFTLITITQDINGVVLLLLWVKEAF